MASSPGAPQYLAERADIHKSCKSLETLLNVLNDYCEAAGAVITLQKKLSKAMRETAGMKVTGEIAANAMNASASIFEALAEIDSKFAKIADKEYDFISAEVKKWFKRLAKEEKAHDDRLASANTKIKQAGQIYEKKSKKNARDAAEEHARYINLISSLGPEVSQEKYNHALQVTERHNATTYSVAACVARVADAEWLRTCEGVRRFSSTIGQLGEWRSLCEGGWTGPIPQDLPDIDSQVQPHLDPPPPNRNPRVNEDTRIETIEGGAVELGNPTNNFNEGSSRAAPDVQPTPISTNQRLLQLQQSLASNSSPSPRQNSSGPSAYDPPNVLSETNTDSVRSLSAFPSPPTHFPLPPMSPTINSRQNPSPSQSSQSRTASSSASQVNFPALPRLTESPQPGEDMTFAEEEKEEESNARPNPLSDLPSPISRPESDNEKIGNYKGQARAKTPPITSDNEARRSVPQRSQTSLPAVENSHQWAASSSRSVSNTGTLSRGDYLADDREFGIKSRTVDIVKSQGIERNDTGGSNGSIVATMRHRYTYTSGTSSPPPKDVLRLPLSVTDLATRYQPLDGPSSPRTRAASPTSSRQLPLPAIDTISQSRKAELPAKGGHGPGAYRPTVEPSLSSITPTPDDEARRRHEMAEHDLKEKERQFRERERMIEQQARELERERAQLMNARREEPPPNDISSRQQRTSFQQQRPQGYTSSSPTSPTNTRPQSQYSYSTSHLAPPAGSGPHSQPRANPSNYSQSSSMNSYSQPPSPASRSQERSSTNEHADNCGCDSCSIAKYKARSAAPSPHDLRPPEKPINLRPEKPDKPKGWIRRLSMPVGNAFSLDSKRGSNLGSGYGAPVEGGRKNNGLFSLDGKRNASTTQLRNGSVQEDGRMGMGGGISRRSYEASGIGNRSMTNLNVGSTKR